MKYLILILPIFCFWNCNLEGEDDTCPTCEVCMECEEHEVLGYKEVDVDFFTSHPRWEAVQTEFEEVSEIVQVQREYNEGAILDTLTELVLIRGAYRYIEVSRQQNTHIVVDVESNTVGEVPCIHFYDDMEIIDTIVPASEYMPVTKVFVVENGNGQYRPPVYREIKKYVVKSPAELNPVDSTQQTFDRITFTIPDTTTIQAYLEDQFAQQGIENCLEDNAYRVVE